MTDDELWEMLHRRVGYNPITGEFRWSKSGKVFGTKITSGYLHAKINYKIYPLHRLAWFMTYREWPNVIDHINGDRADNRLCNLRNTTTRGNCQNRNHHRNGRLVGTCWIAKSQKWRASIRVNGQCKFLGEFPTELEAHSEYLRWANGGA